MLITLSGVIGSGKTSLTTMLAERLKTKPFFESVEDNEVLPLFYAENERIAKLRKHGVKETNRYAYLLQTYFLNTRFAAIKEAMLENNNVLDRSIYEDKIFMKMNVDMGNATLEEWHVYENLLDNMMEETKYLPKKSPDLMIFIKVSYETMLKRITKRGREFEQIEEDKSLPDYYKNLIEYYENWYKEYDKSPLLVIDGDRYDFVDNEEDCEAVMQLIRNKLKEVGAMQ